MTKSVNTRFGLAAILAGALLAAGCSDDDGFQQLIPPPPPPPPPGAVAPETAAGQLGAGFQAAFTAAPNDAPIDPQAGDIVDVDPTADPIDITNPA
ncbi:MAG: hypothetical protein AAFR11_02560 [Pseudomonadota bacterium]